MDRDPGSRFGAYSLSQICPRLGKEPRARFYAENARVLRKRADATLMLWRQVLHTPDDAEVHARLAEQLLKAGDLEQARYQLEQAARLRPSREESRRQADIIGRLLALREP
jgi:Flp pilus assembly protein TadD